MKNWREIKNKIILFLFVFLFIFLAFFFSLKSNNKKTESNIYIENKNIEAPFAMPDISMTVFSENVCNIKKYGAVGDGKFLNTQPIKNAIEDCSQKGGGKIVFPKGKWLTGPIHLKSNINLYLEKNSEIIFTTNLDDYLPVVFSKFQGMEYYNFSPPIYANGCENIALTGKGKIFGNGAFWANWIKTDNSEIQREKLFKMSQDNVPVEERVWGTSDSGLRPSFIQFINCKNIFIEGLNIEDGPMWTIHPIYSENIVIKGVNINTYSVNTDGIAIESSKNVLVENSNFSTGDDAIAIKSGLEEEGMRINRPSENIVVKNSKFSKGHGAIAIGSEMSGGVRNVFINNSSFEGTGSVLRIKSTKSRGGFIENIWIENTRAENVNEGIVINLKYTSALKTSGASRHPILKNINVKNISGENMEKAIRIEGLPDGIMENIIFENLKFQTRNQSEIKSARNIELKNVFLKTDLKESALKIENGQSIKIDNLKCDNNENLCLNIEGKKTYNIDVSKSGIEKNRIFIEDTIKKEVKME